jgi:hypothetical protein
MMISPLSKPTSFSPRFSGVPQEVETYLKDYDNLKKNASGDVSVASTTWTHIYATILPFEFTNSKDRIDTLRHVTSKDYPLGVIKMLMGDNHPYKTLSDVNSYYDTNGNKIRSFDPAKIVNNKKDSDDDNVKPKTMKKKNQKQGHNPFRSIKKTSEYTYTKEHFKAIANYFQQHPEAPSANIEHKIAGKIISLAAMKKWHALWLDAAKPSSDTFADMLMK